MAKSMRSKREKRLRAIRREIVEPYYENKEAAKLAAQEAALAAPKLPVRSHNSSNKATDMDVTTNATTSPLSVDMDVEIGEASNGKGFLKPIGGIGKKLKKKIKLSKKKRGGKGKIRKKNV